MSQPESYINSPVTPATPTVYYCDPGDVQRRLSILGIQHATEDYGPANMAGEGGVIEDCIWDATEIINYYCQVLYRPEDLVRSTWINRRATDIAVYILASRRGNIQSASLSAAYKQALEWLDKIHNSQFEVPGTPIRATQAPAWSNVRIDQRYPTFRVRVERSISQKAPTPYSQSPDWSSEFDFSI